MLLLLLVFCGAATAAPSRPTLFVAAGGSDAAKCTKASPCRTFGRAYAVAKPGQIVEVAAGAYPDQDVDLAPGRTGAPVVFTAAKGARVTVSDLDVRGTLVEFRNLRIRAWEAHETANRVTFRNINGQGFWITGASNVRVFGGSAGPGLDIHPQIQASYGTNVVPTNIVIDGVRFHDWKRTGPAAHTECLQIGGGNGIVIRRSRFVNCAVMDLHISHWGDTPQTRNVLVENNFFGEPLDDGPFSVQAVGIRNLVIRNNSALSGFVVFDELGPGPVTLSANVAPAQPWECNDAVSYKFNVWTNTKCGATDRRAPSGFRDPGRLDLRLKPGAAAIDRGDPSSFPLLDIEQQRRPRGRAPDAGADEAR
jgi:hypothetical protein